MKNILIIDDNPSFVGALKFAIEPWGRVECCSSKALFFEKYEGQQWDLVLLDYALPDCSGYDLVFAIRGNSPQALIYLISGVLDKDIAKRGFDYRINGILEKPFEVEELRLKLRESGWFAEEILLQEELRRISVGPQSWELTEIEFQIVKAIKNSTNLITRKEIEDLVWRDLLVSKNVFDTHLYNLKQKVPVLKDKIKVILGRGYQWG